jgi:hypothetical protein
VIQLPEPVEYTRKFSGNYIYHVHLSK